MSYEGMIRMNRLVACLLLTSVAMLGCGSDPEPEVAAAPPAPKPAAAVPAPAATAPAEDPTARMARAVGNGKPGAAVQIRYEFLAKPAVGEPIELEIALVPSVGVDSLDARVSGMDGITLAGPLNARFDGVEAGKPYMHKVSVLPERSGVYYVTVAVSTEIGGQALARTFSIPFVVGNVSAQQKAEPGKDATGTPVEPMKAQETRR
jgi:hypothetical protein